MHSTAPSFSDRRLQLSLQRGPQRREAFRIRLRMPVYVQAPMSGWCELLDISFIGVGLDRELPSVPGTKVTFRLETPTYGDLIVATPIVLEAEVVRIGAGRTGLRLLDLDGEQGRVVQELVAARQRTILAARSARRNPRTFRP